VYEKESSPACPAVTVSEENKEDQAKAVKEQHHS